IGSVYGGQASAIDSVDSASKCGLSSFVQGYAREVASTNLTVNVIAPGAVDTPMNAIFDAETLNEVKNEIPAGRLADPKDISFWVENLLDERSDYLTGQTIYVDGGWLVYWSMSLVYSYLNYCNKLRGSYGRCWRLLTQSSSDRGPV